MELKRSTESQTKPQHILTCTIVLLDISELRLTAIKHCGCYKRDMCIQTPTDSSPAHPISSHKHVFILLKHRFSNTIQILNNTVTIFINKTDTAIMIQRQNCE